MFRSLSNRRRKAAHGHVAGIVATLESRTLLAGVMQAVQVDGEAPEVFADTETHQLLILQDSDSTRLLASDGTQAGTTQLADIPGLFSASHVLGANGQQLVFRVPVANQLWVTDGTVGGTFKLKDLAVSNTPGTDSVFGGEIYFSASDATTGDGFELWKTDGTVAGTVQVADINTGQAGPAGHTFTWDAVSGAESYDVEIFAFESERNAGNTSTRRLISMAVGDDVPTNSFSATGVFNIAPLDEGWFNVVTRANFSNGTQGPAVTTSAHAVAEIDGVSSHPSEFRVFDGELYFTAETRDVGRELWKSDGTAAGTVLAADVISGPASSYPLQLMEFDNHLFFGSLGDHDLYRFDGTTAVSVAAGEGVSHSLMLQKSLRTPAQLVGSFPVGIINGKLVAQQMGDGNGSVSRRLISFESGTAVPTDLGVTGGLAILSPYTGELFFDGFTEVNDHLVFRRNTFSDSPDTIPNGTLWSTDGTTAVQLVSENVFSSRVPVKTFGTLSGDQLRFAGQSPSIPGLYVTQTKAWKTDGTVDGTSVIVESDFFDGKYLDEYAFLADRTFGLRAVTNSSFDLYQIDSNGERFTLARDLSRGDFVEYVDQLFIDLPTENDGTALFRVDPRTFQEPLTITGGAGNVTTSTPTLIWTDGGSNVLRYDLYINVVGNRSTPIYRITDLTTFSHTVQTALGDGRYEVWVRAVYQNGQSTRWGQPTSLTVGTPVAPSTRPVVTAPLSSITTARPEFTWTSIPNAVGYEIWISNTTSSAPIIRQTGIIGTSFTPSVDLAAGSYRFWVRAITAGGPSGWSSAQRFSRFHEPVQIFNGTGTQITTTPTFNWTGDPNVDHWDLYIQQAGQSGPFYRRQTLTTNTHTVEEAFPEGEYVVWLRAFYSDGSTSRWGESGRPLTISTSPRPTVHLPEGTVGQSSPFFEWELPIGNVQGNVTAYDLRITEASTNNVVSEITFTADDVFVFQRREYRYSGVLPANDYFVEVRAHYDTGAVSAFSEPVAFSVLPSPPYILTGGGVQGTQTPTFTWFTNPTDATYEIRLTKVAGGTGAVYQRSGLTSANHTVEDPLELGRYHVEVRVTDRNGFVSDYSSAVVSLEDAATAFPQTRPQLSIENGVATWTEIPTADRYQLHVDQLTDSGNLFRWRLYFNDQITATTFDFNSVLGPGDFRVWLIALRDSDNANSLPTGYVNFSLEV